MNTFRYLLFLLLLILLVFPGCKKSNLSGDYIVCKINGHSWAAGCNDAFSDCLEAQWSNNRTDFLLGPSNGVQDMGICLYDLNGLKSGTYKLNLNDFCPGANFRDYNLSYHYLFYTDSVNTGTITIKFDSINKRVSGTFSFRARYRISDSIVNITDGQFSVPCQIY